MTTATGVPSWVELARHDAAGSDISAFGLRYGVVPCEEMRQALMDRLRDEIRRSARQGRTVVLLDRNDTGSAASLFDEAAALTAAARYEAALARLRPEDREAVVARVEQDRNYEMLAQALGQRSADAAREAVSRALLRLAQEMSRGE